MISMYYLHEIESSTSDVGFPEVPGVNVDIFQVNCNNKPKAALVIKSVPTN